MNESISINTSSDWIKYGVGMVYMRKGRYEAAEAKFNEIIAINPSYGNAYLQLGLIRKSQKRNEEARTIFEKAIKQDPKNEMLNYQSGLLHVEHKNYDNAAERFTIVLELNASHIDAMINLGLVYGRKGVFYRAETLINDAYLLDDKQKDGFARLGWIKTENRDWSGALEIMKMDLQENRISPAWQINLSQMVGRFGDWDRAMELIARSYASDQEIKDGYARLGWIKTENRDWSGALEIMKMDLQENRISPTWQVNLAQLYGRKGEWEHAIEFIERAYAADRDLKDGFARLAWIKTESQDWSGAFDLMIKDLKKDRLSTGWHVNWAVLHVFMGEYDEAIKLIEDLYRQDASAADGYARIGWAQYLSQKDEQRLQLLLDKDSSLNRLADSGKKIMAYSMGMRGALDPACMLMDSLYSKHSSLMDGFAVLGWECVEKGKLKEGIMLMEKDYFLNRLSSIWRINYVYQLAKLNQSERAQTIFNEVLKSKPSRQEFRIGYPHFPTRIMTLSQFQQFVSICS